MKRYLQCGFLCLLVTLLMLALSLTAEAKEQTTSLDENVNFTLYETLLQGIRETKAEIDIRDGHYTVDELSATYTYLMLEEPDLFYINGNYTYSMPQDRSIVLCVKPDYRYTGDQLTAKMADYNAKIAAITGLVDPLWTEMEKLVFLHEYVCSHFTYDDDYLIADAYTMLEAGEGVCQGYTLLLDKLLSEVGIESTSVLSDTLNHVWNEVKIDGRWYHVDATWNDSTDDYTFGGFNTHDYFMLSNEALLQAHPERADMVCRYSCDSTLYDGSALQTVTSEIVYLNGQWYGAAENVLRLNLADGTGQVIAPLPQKWHATTGTYFNTQFCTLYVYGDVLLYNTDTAICYYNPKSDTYGVLRKPIATYYYLYGFSVQGDTLTYSVGNKPEQAATGDATLSLPPALRVTVTYKANDVTVKTQTYTKGDLLVLPKTPFTYKENQSLYVIVGIENAESGDTLTQDLTVYVTLGEETLYTVTWVIDCLSYTENYVYGELPICPYDTKKAPTEDIYYAFDGFFPAIGEVTADVTYTAQYRQERNYYFATLSVNGKNETQRVVRGEEPMFPAVAPTRPPYDRYTYTFEGWQLQATEDNGDRLYVAVFSATALYEYSAEQFVRTVSTMRVTDKLTASYATLYYAYKISQSVNFDMPGVAQAKELLLTYITLYNAKATERRTLYYTDLQATLDALGIGLRLQAFSADGGPIVRLWASLPEGFDKNRRF